MCAVTREGKQPVGRNLGSPPAPNGSPPPGSVLRGTSLPLGTWEHLCGAAQPADCFPLVQIWGEVVLWGLGRSSWELGSAGEGALGEEPMSKLGWGGRGKLRLVEFWGWTTLQSCPTWRLGHSGLCQGPGPLWDVAGRVLHSGRKGGLFQSFDERWGSSRTFGKQGFSSWLQKRTRGHLSCSYLEGAGAPKGPSHDHREPCSANNLSEVETVFPSF